MGYCENKQEMLLRHYREDPNYIQRDFGIEESVLGGGYEYRQIVELIQNGADAILEGSEDSDGEARIDVVLTEDYLYVANTGAPLTQAGVDALLMSHLSTKRKNQIGRFGIGFKSLLLLGGKVDVISRPLALQFDQERCREKIGQWCEVQKATKLPGFRMAWDLDGEMERREDPILSGMDWPTTVVRAHIAKPEVLDDLQREMREFHAEFVLFLPVDTQLRMVFPDGSTREIRRESKRKRVYLLDGESSSVWRLHEKTIAVDDPGAKEDATGIHYRDEVPFIWAFPEKGADASNGKCWSFFPTKTSSGLPGILNASWKLDSGRTALEPGKWNHYIMEQAAPFLADVITGLSSKRDPALPMDAFPLDLEDDETVTPLVDAVWQELLKREVVPDAMGTLRLANLLYRPPIAESRLVKKWEALAGTRVKQQVCGAACCRKERWKALGRLRARLVAADREETDASSDAFFRQFISGPSSSIDPHKPMLAPMPLGEWYSVVAGTSINQAIQSVSLVDACQQALTGNERLDEYALGDLIILPDTDKILCSANQAILAPKGQDLPGKYYLHQKFWEDKKVREILKRNFGLEPFTDKDWGRLLKESIDSPDEFWTLALAAPKDVWETFAKDLQSKLLFKCRDGEWKPCYGVLLPGETVGDNDEQNSGILVDQAFLARVGKRIPKDLIKDTIPLWRTRGVTLGDSNTRHEYSRFRDWYKNGRDQFLSDQKPGMNPQKNKIVVKKASVPLWTELYLRLTGGARSRATCELLGLYVASGDSMFAVVSFEHQTRDIYQETRRFAPATWILAKHGAIEVARESVSLDILIGLLAEPFVQPLFGDSISSAKLEGLAELGRRIPAMERRRIWQAIFRDLLGREDWDASWLSSLWRASMRERILPRFVPVVGKEYALGEIHVSDKPGLVHEAREAGVPALCLPSDVLPFWLQEGAQSLETSMGVVWEKEIRPLVPLPTFAPELSRLVSSGNDIEVGIRLVSGLLRTIGGRRFPVEHAMDGEDVLLDASTLDKRSEDEQARILLTALDEMGLLDRPKTEAEIIIFDEARRKRLKYISDGRDLAERLWRAAGEDVAPLRDLVLGLSGRVLTDGMQPLDLARLALTVTGPVVLSELAETFQQQDLRPPERWGGTEAQRFVESLGFPLTFAQAKTARREAEEVVMGPNPLGALHDFQKDVVTDLKRLMGSESEVTRAIVSLPTGSGKTRVAVESAVRYVLKDACRERLVLWVAQTDELCEQALQAFYHVWQNEGNERENLRIIRLWGGNTTPKAAQSQITPTVVVATIQTLNARMDHEALRWLARPSLTIIDECHHAITKSYTGLLRWVDEANNHGEQSPPLLGLSATPFRGDQDGEESRRLANRFHGNLFPGDQASLYGTLLERGILSRLIPEPIDSDVGIRKELEAELDDLQERDADGFTGLEWDRLFEKINRELAVSVVRNQKIVDQAMKHRDKRILFFANSVDHAKEMAIRFTMAGLPSAPVSGTTPPVARRHFLDQFCAGEIKVLCNHSVLTTGFDAPETDLLLISRQVHSPVRYMQMVGRGMRGPKNGGTESCILMTVLDNLGRFSDHQPYHYCQRYFPTYGSKR